MEAVWHHTAISVKNMDRACRFYRDLLGFEVEWERPVYSGDKFADVVGMAGAAAHVVMLKGYGARIELFQYHTPAGTARGPMKQSDYGLTHLAFSVKNIHEIYDDLSRQDVKFNCPPQNLRPGVYATYMKDPEGNTIELVEYREKDLD